MSEAEKIKPLDWQRMFIGDTDPLFLLEIVLRTGIIFIWLLLLLRITGKRGLAQLSPVELAIVIGLGSAAGDPMFYPEVPLLHAMLVLAVVVGFQRLLTALVNGNEQFETFVEGKPVELVRDGMILPGQLDKVKLSREDLFENLRAQQVRQLGQVQRAYFEQDGKLSVFLHPKGEAPAGLAIVPPWDIEWPFPPPASYSGPRACLNCGRVTQGGRNQCECGGDKWTPATTDPLGQS